MTTTPEDLDTWIARAALGDRDALRQIYGATSAKLFGVCLRVLKDRADAEEVLQDVYIRIWHASGRYRPGEASPISWMVTIARNRSIDKLRSRQSTAGDSAADDTEAAAVADPSPGPEQMAIRRSEQTRLRACLDTLPADRAEAVTGAYLDGQTYADLAERFGVPLNTMRTWLRRSLIALKDCLSQ